MFAYGKAKITLDTFGCLCVFSTLQYLLYSQFGFAHCLVFGSHGEAKYRTERGIPLTDLTPQIRFACLVLESALPTPYVMVFLMYGGLR